MCLCYRSRRLDHQGFVDDEREVVRGRVEVVVYQKFGDVQCAYSLPCRRCRRVRAFTVIICSAMGDIRQKSEAEYNVFREDDHYTGFGSNPTYPMWRAPYNAKITK